MMMKVVVGVLACFVLAHAADDCVTGTETLDQLLEKEYAITDQDGDGMVTRQEIANDLTANYDTNSDGTVTEEEFFTRRACAFGETRYEARFVQATSSDGEGNFNISEILVSDRVATKDQIIMYNRAIANAFKNLSCVNADLTADQKLDRIVADNDFNKDGTVNADDIAYDLNNRYDADGDGQVTVTEWTLRWLCAYGDSIEFASYVLNQLKQGATVIQASDFSGPPFDAGFPVAAFRDMNKRRYADFAASQTGAVGK